MIYIGVQFISGFMVGMEFIWEDKAMVIDIGIFRFLIQIDNQSEK